MSWPVIPYKPKGTGESDQTPEEMLIDLERLEGEGSLRVIQHGGERGYHIKLVIDPERVVSLFVWNEKIFQGKPTLVRSYGVWPIEAMEVDEEKGDKVLAEGVYNLRGGVLTMNIRKSYDPKVPEGIRCYRLRLARIREYMSPKHGWSVRPEYYAIPLQIKEA